MRTKKKMGMVLSLCGILLSSSVWAQTQHKAVVDQGSSPSGENWKGRPYDHNLDVHGGAGLGIFDGSVGLAFIFGAAVKVAHEGLIGDGINDQVFVELSTGPLLTSGVDPWLYSLHMRWDFHMDLDWTFYALGGLSGSFGTGVGRFFPRFGAGVVRKISDEFGIRGEISHEWLTFGVSFGF